MDPAQLGNVTAYLEGGEPIQLKYLWRDKPTILIFLRHFACIACRAHAKDIWDRREAYEKAGTRVAFVGNGAPVNLMMFKKEMGLESALILTDPSLQAFAAAGFKRSFIGAYGPAAALNYISLSARGFSQSTHRPGDGDRLQLGGVLLIMPDGHVRYKFTATATGHFPAHSDLDYVTRTEVQPFSLEPVSPAEQMPDHSRR